jgi:tRNA nucleotidyltransferase (CCA-adding enzyme)
METPQNWLPIAQILLTQNIRSYWVGGCIRDLLLEKTPSDWDIVLEGVSDIDDLIKTITPLVNSITKDIGAQFPVWKVKLPKSTDVIESESFDEYDIALCRVEKKSGVTRQEFSVSWANVTIEQDLLRRDLTINAIAKDCITGELIDPYFGQLHLLNKIAHPVSQAFCEDPLRVIRAARFIAKFRLTPSPELICYSKSLVNEPLSGERIGMELRKLFESGCSCFPFFNFLKLTNWLPKYFIELDDLIGIPQDRVWHPEGDAYCHTLYTVDEARDPFTKMVMLCHDLGKATTTKISKRGYWTAPSHEIASVPLTESLCKRIFWADFKEINQIKVLVKHHMIHAMDGIATKTHVIKRTLRDLLKVGLTYDHLVEVCRCDVSGRPPLIAETPDIGQNLIPLFDSDWIIPLVNGDMLLEKGVPVGPHYKTILEKCIIFQDRGQLTKDKIGSGQWFNLVKTLNLF